MVLVLTGRHLMNNDRHRYHSKGSLLSRIESIDSLGLIPHGLEASPDLKMIAPIEEDRSGKSMLTTKYRKSKLTSMAEGKQMDAAIKP
jgi:hypothetical protein